MFAENPSSSPETAGTPASPKPTRSMRKRDGHTLQPFDEGKLRRAVRRAWEESRGAVDERSLNKVIGMVLSVLEDGTVDVECVQDAVETALMRQGQFTVAKAFIVYRHKRAEARQGRTNKTPDPKAISDYIHAGKYARYVPLWKRREVFVETVARVEEMHLGQYPQMEAEIRRSFDLVRAKRVLPSMRSMQFGGPAVLANHNRIYNCMGVETEFITTQGVKKFSDFKDGDKITVLTHTGAWKSAVVKSYGTQQLFEVIIGRGRSAYTVRATRNHQWVLQDGQRTNDLSVKHKLAKAPRLVGAWEYQDANPEARYYWALGYVYGDGTLVKGREGEYMYSMVRLCGADKGRFLERFKELGFATSAPASFGGDAMAYTGKYLKTLPSIEKDGFENVMAFVRGYLDADGHKNENGDWPSPFNGIQATGGEAIDFIRSVFPAVGAYITREDDLTGQETNFGIRPETSRFGLVLGFGDAPSSPYSVQGIKEAVHETVWCLEVEDDHSFVLPNGIVTGNCSFSLVDRPEVFSEALYLLLSGCGVGYSVQFDHVERLPTISYIDPKKVRHHVIEDTIEGWADALKALVQSYLDGVNLEFAYHLIRDAGSPLRTSGGRAPGHLRLKDSLERIRGVLGKAQGRKLRSVECHRIMCHAADAVLSGGIRRSAMICLFSLDDSEMMHIKTGDWFSSEPWLANSNNSVVLKRDEVKKKQFKRIFAMTKQWGEPGFYFTNDYDYGTNPCFHPDTRLWTSQGYVKVGDLFKDGNPNQVVRDVRVGKGDVLEGDQRGLQIAEATHVFLTQKNAPVFKLTTEHGYHVTVTAPHEFPTPCGRKKLSDLRPGDTLLLPSGEGSFGTRGTLDEGLLLGLFVGDGTSETDASYIDLWESDFDQKDRVLSALNAVMEKEPTHRGGRIYGPVQWQDQVVPEDGDLKVRAGGTRFLRWLKGLADQERLSVLKDRVPESVWRGSRDFVVGYLRGLFATDGTVLLGGKGTKATLSLRLCQSNPDLLEDVQVLLGMFGVVSRLYSRRPAGPKLLPDNKGQGEMREYHCKEQFELVLNRPNTIRFHQSVGLFGGKAAILADRLGARGVTLRKPERFITRVVAIEPAGTTDVYCLTQPETNSVIANGIVTAQCCEIGMNPKLTITEEEQAKLAKRDIQVTLGQVYTGWGFCNLCEINAAKMTSYEDFEEAARAATLIGTLQAGYTKMPYLGWVSELLAEREALLGIGMTGMLDAPHIACNPEFQRQVAQKIKQWNAEYAARIGVNPAARTTCVKPSGTTSLELGCVASGHHAHHGRRYIRRVTADELEYVFQAFRAVNPHMCVRKPDGKWVIEFPVAAPSGATVKEDLTAIQFLDMVRSTQQNWVLPGTSDSKHSPGLNHNVSNTVTVRPEEWDRVADYLWENREFFTGVSLLASTGDKDFAFAPNEEVLTPADEARWNAILENYRPVDYTVLVEETDATNLTGEVACAGGVCQLV